MFLAFDGESFVCLCSGAKSDSPRWLVFGVLLGLGFMIRVACASCVGIWVMVVVSQVGL